MDHATLFGHLALVVGQALGLWYQWTSEGRRHRWQLEQRSRLEALKVQIQNGHGE